MVSNRKRYTPQIGSIMDSQHQSTGGNVTWDLEFSADRLYNCVFDNLNLSQNIPLAVLNVKY